MASVMSTRTKTITVSANWGLDQTTVRRLVGLLRASWEQQRPYLTGSKPVGLITIARLIPFNELTWTRSWSPRASQQVIFVKNSWSLAPGLKCTLQATKRRSHRKSLVILIRALEVQGHRALLSMP